MRSIVSTRGRIVLPAKLRHQDQIEAGQIFEIERVGCGEYRLSRRPYRTESLVEWLLACPEKGFFTPID
jgi:bifunctional DNA-binding transcriptional regulator/antitoxin component of YhaV-PrlF toxin-antitoxin module